MVVPKLIALSNHCYYAVITVLFKTYERKDGFCITTILLYTAYGISFLYFISWEKSDRIYMVSRIHLRLTDFSLSHAGEGRAINRQVLYFRTQADYVP